MRDFCVVGGEKIKPHDKRCYTSWREGRQIANQADAIGLSPLIQWIEYHPVMRV